MSQTSGITSYCWKAFDTRGKPHTSLLTGTSKLSCPAGYSALSAGELKGNNGNSYVMATDAGFYLDYVDSWGPALSQTFKSSYQYRTLSTETQTTCLKVMGVGAGSLVVRADRGGRGSAGLRALSRRRDPVDPDFRAGPRGDRPAALQLNRHPRLAWPLRRPSPRPGLGEAG